MPLQLKKTKLFKKYKYHNFKNSKNKQGKSYKMINKFLLFRIKILLSME